MKSTSSATYSNRNRRKLVPRFSESVGFTVIEMITVMAIISIVSVFMIRSFNTGGGDVNMAANTFISHLRLAQTKATSIAQLNGENVCGYGIHQKSGDNNSYILFANASLNGDCPEQKYIKDVSRDVETFKLPGSSMEFKSPNSPNQQNPLKFADIFFEPPNPKTYLGGNPPTTTPETITITIGIRNQNCPESCKKVEITSTGKIGIQ